LRTGLQTACFDKHIAETKYFSIFKPLFKKDPGKINHLK